QRVRHPSAFRSPRAKHPGNRPLPTVQWRRFAGHQPPTPYRTMPSSGTFTTRPVYMGTHGVIASGHYLGARAGQRMFDPGGNAIDAAVASGFALNVLEPQSCGIGGEVPILVFPAKEGKPVAISGQGWAGKAATVEWFRQAKVDPIPGDGFL